MTTRSDRPPLELVGSSSPTELTLDALLDQLAERIAERILAELRRSTPTSSEDRLLTAQEAAQVLGISPAWLQRGASKLPFARKLGRRTVRFSSAGMQRWLARRGG